MVRLVGYAIPKYPERRILRKDCTGKEPGSHMSDRDFCVSGEASEEGEEAGTSVGENPRQGHRRRKGRGPRMISEWQIIGAVFLNLDQRKMISKFKFGAKVGCTVVESIPHGKDDLESSAERQGRCQRNWFDRYH